MRLILNVTSGKPQLPDRMNRVVFDHQGGGIGRAQDNICVLPDPEQFISSQHAVIRFQDDSYLLTDTSLNGVFINDSVEPVGNNKTVRLHDGDCLVMGDYELRVSIESLHQSDSLTRSGSGAELHDIRPKAPPWGVADTPGKAPDILVGDAQHQKMPGIHVGDKGKDFVSQSRRPATEPDHIPAEQEHFPPPLVQKEQISSQQRWDSTDMISSADDEAGFPAEGKGAEQPSAPDQNAGGMLDWDRTDFVAPAVQPESSGGGRDSPENVSSSQAVHPEPDPDPGIANEQMGELKHVQPDLPDATEGSKQESASRSPVKQVNPGQSAQAFFEAAGLDATQLSPEEAADLMKLFGRLYRDIVQGLMEVLMARSDLKNEFRMRHTQIRATENNPLKFSGRVEEALEHLVFNRSSGFLSPEAAFQEAFQDIKDHQIAMVVGMRAAFESLLRRFDPEQLERRVVKRKKLGNLLPRNRKASCWERYEEWYAEISAAAEDDFQGMFGDEFTRAYEDQVARLSLLRKKSEK